MKPLAPLICYACPELDCFWYVWFALVTLFFFFFAFMLLGILGWIAVGTKIIKWYHFVMEIKDSIFHHTINLFRVCLILIIFSGFLFLLSRVLLRQNISWFYFIEGKQLEFDVLFSFFYAFHWVFSHPLYYRKSDGFERWVQIVLGLTLPLIYLVSIPEENLDSHGILIANIALRTI